jgi:hypothetical protein
MSHPTKAAAGLTPAVDRCARPARITADFSASARGIADKIAPTCNKASPLAT